MIERTCHVNLLGTFLGYKNSSVSVRGEQLILITGSSSSTIPIDSLNQFPKVVHGFFGSSLIFSTSECTYTSRFLKKNETNKVFDHVASCLVSVVTNHIQKTYKRFQDRAITSFLRDSDVPFLDEIVSQTLQFYDSLCESRGRKGFDDQVLEKIKLLRVSYPISASCNELRKAYEKYRLNQRLQFYDVIESNPLTDQQRLAVVRDNDRNLVLAAAGTGKTSVMVAKTLDLIDSGRCSPNEILVLAYNKAAAEELKDRMILRANRAKLDTSTLPEIRTFHALGRNILIESGIRPRLSRFSEDRVLLLEWATEWFTSYIQKNPNSMKNFVELMYQPINPFDFKTKEEYDAYVRDNEYRALNGELVRGYQELCIANWFFMNCVDYEYEGNYKTKRRIEIGYDYKPDFHFTGTDIYLEHFGIDRSGNTRPDIDKHLYNESILKKRELHQECETTLLETYHYDWVEGQLETRLEELIEQESIPHEKRPFTDIFEKLKETGAFNQGVERYLKCLEAIRIECLSHDQIIARLAGNKVPNADKYAALLIDFHDAYRSYLMEKDEIDFDDMILRATEAVDSNKYKPAWKYILVDEFQDISMARMNFLNSLVINGPNPTLTVVGDDWQSIYRFSGGKLELTTRFDEMVGSYSLTKLEKTFRYNSSIAHTAGTFVMENPEQYRKEVVTHDVVSKPQVYLLDTKVGSENNIEERTKQIIGKILENDPSASIAVLARYNYLLRNTRDAIHSSSIKQPIKYWTFHGSKGLEADYCILIGFFQGKTGFPNMNKEEAVVEALLPTLDTFEHSEERRLLYVALTRARKKSYILADPFAPSEFITEMLSPKYKVHIASSTFKEEYRKIFKCHVCSTGYFRLQNGQFGNFYSCTTGRNCKSKPRVCPKCGSPSLDDRDSTKCNNARCKNEMPICSKCGRPMKLRDGKFGKFWGCTGFGIKDDQCKYTRKYFK